MEENNLVLYIYTNTFVYGEKNIKPIFDNIFKKSNAKYKLVSQKAPLFFNLALLLDRKYNVIIYSDERHFLPRTFYDQLKIRRESQKSLILKSSRKFSDFDISLYDDLIHFSEIVLDEMCQPNYNFEEEKMKGPKSESSSSGSSFSTLGTSLSFGSNFGSEETKASSSDSVTTASSLVENEEKFKEIFDDLLPKLMNKNKEKSREFTKLVADLDNTIVSTICQEIRYSKNSWLFYQYSERITSK